MFISFGIARYFHKELIRKLEIPGTKFLISFDESINTIIKKEQMNSIAWFWDNLKKRRLYLRCLNFQFLGNTRASESDLLQSFKLALSKVNSKFYQSVCGWTKHQLEISWQLESPLILHELPAFKSMLVPVVYMWFVVLLRLVCWNWKLDSLFVVPAFRFSSRV